MAQRPHQTVAKVSKKSQTKEENTIFIWLHGLFVRFLTKM